MEAFGGLAETDGGGDETAAAAAAEAVVETGATADGLAAVLVVAAVVVVVAAVAFRPPPPSQPAAASVSGISSVGGPARRLRSRANSRSRSVRCHSSRKPGVKRTELTMSYASTTVCTAARTIGPSHDTCCHSHST